MAPSVNKASFASLDESDNWERACRELAQRDSVLGQVIQEAGKGKLVCRNDPFQTLARSIIGQQISVKAADSIWRRFQEACPDCSPLAVALADFSLLGACGLSKRKIGYLRDLAFHFLERKIRFGHWHVMSDEEIIADLTQVRGVGRWTAEMFLIFSLGRPDVLPQNDIGLQKGISRFYFSGKPVSGKDIRTIAENWKPWRTVATWYLWRSLIPLPVEY